MLPLNILECAVVVATQATLQKESGMQLLPAEIKRFIYEYCSPREIQTLRLVNRAWSHVGRDYLLPALITIRPYRDDINRLLQISQHPYFRTKVQSILYERIEIDDFIFRCHLHIVTAEAKNMRVEFDAAAAAFSKLENMMHLYTDAQQEAEFYNIFRNLPNLEGVTFVKKDCPFPAGSFGGRAWMGMANEINQLGDTGFQHITESLVDAGAKLKHLTLTRVSFVNMWYESQRFLGHMFVNLQSVKLQIECPNTVYDIPLSRELSFNAMLGFLASAKGLREIWLGFVSSYPDPLRELPKELEGNVWPELHTLTLKLTSWPLHIITTIIRNHPTIRRFRYLGRYLFPFQNRAIQEDEVAFMKALRNTKLEMVDILEQAHISDGGIRYTHIDEIGLYDDDWNATNRMDTKYSRELGDMALGKIDIPEYVEPS